jgi:hypothetical protein
LAVWLDEHVYALGLETPREHQRDFGVLPDQQSRQHFDLRDGAAEAREALRELAAYRPPPSTTSRLGSWRRPHTVSEVNGGISRKPGMGGIDGRAPAAITMFLVVSV